MKIFEYLIDFIFPPSQIELKLRSVSPIKLFETANRAVKSEFSYITSIFSYKDPVVREMIWQIKYKKNRHAIECAAYALYMELIRYGNSITLIPIPISSSRRKERGYNQCEILIDAVLRLDKDKRFSKDFSLLVRSKHIDKQTMKSRVDRIKNTKNVFEVNKVPLTNQKIIIIDDVTTTGSTLKEAYEVLVKSNFTVVKALTVAH